MFEDATFGGELPSVDIVVVCSIELENPPEIHQI